MNGSILYPGRAASGSRVRRQLDGEGLSIRSRFLKTGTGLAPRRLMSVGRFASLPRLSGFPQVSNRAIP